MTAAEVRAWLQRHGIGDGDRPAQGKIQMFVDLYVPGKAKGDGPVMVEVECFARTEDGEPIVDRGLHERLLITRTIPFDVTP